MGHARATSIENHLRGGSVPWGVRWIRLAASAIALIVSITACGPPPSVEVRSGAARSSPAGQLLLATGDSGSLYSAADGKRSVGAVQPFELSPDGLSALGARSQSEATGITRTTELVIVETTSLEEKAIVVAGDREAVGPAQWSPDGSRIAYRLTTYDVDPSEVHPGERLTEAICVRSISRSENRCFHPPGRVYSFDWFPDGNGLLIAGPGGDPVLHLDVETGRAEAVISPKGDDALRVELSRLGYGEPDQFVLPQWSPSGRYIAVLVSLRGGSQMYVPVVLTSAGTFVSVGEASGEFPDAFAWAPARDILAYTAGKAPYAITELYTHDPMTGTNRHLATTDGEGPMIPRIDGLAWSPDGSWIAFSRPEGVRVVHAEGEEPARELDVRGTVVDWGPEQLPATSGPSPSPSGSPSPEESAEASDEYVGFHPASRVENGNIVMPLTFVDGSSAEAVAPPNLGIQDMSAAIYTSGGLGSVDRTMDFRYLNGSSFIRRDVHRWLLTGIGGNSRKHLTHRSHG